MGDINGDGFVDHVSYVDNTVTLKLSNLGKINRLKKVENPLEGEFREFDYKHINGIWTSEWKMGDV